VDKQFVSFVQFFLHKCGEITLGEMFITSSKNWNGPKLIFDEENQMPLAEVPIPENIKDFETIYLRYASTIKFCKN
jgi:hypothetical protein